MIKNGDKIAFGAQFAVIRNGKTMSFIANPLDKVQRLGMTRQNHRFTVPFGKDMLKFLGQTNDRRSSQSAATDDF